jgi:DnaJ like chaperone protein
MSWFGKVIGGAFGFVMGGPLGALLGAALGHRFDQEKAGAGAFSPEAESAEQYRERTAFFTALFSTMGHVAKADGRVTEAEIDAARRIMTRLNLNEDMRKTAARLFSEGKRPGFPLEPALEQFRAECRDRHALLRLFVELLLETALADGPLSSEEERLLLRVCERLRFSRFEFHVLRALLEPRVRAGEAGRESHRRPSASARDEPALHEAYALLGMKSSADDEEIRRAYRRLLSQAHPDKLAAQGASEEKVRAANEKTRRLRKAWEVVRKARGI